jgi:YD repeat-containing protein
LLHVPSVSTFYTWDVHNRLIQAEPVAGRVTYAYDGDGKRMRREAPAETRRFVYDFDKVLQDTDDTGLTQEQFASTEQQYGSQAFRRRLEESHGRPVTGWRGRPARVRSAIYARSSKGSLMARPPQSALSGGKV